MEQDGAAELLVRSDILFLHAVTMDEIHQGERMIRVVDGLIVAAQGQPGDATVIELDELAVGLGALMRRHGPGRGLTPGRLASPGRVMPQVIEIGRKSVRSHAVGPSAHLELEDTQLDPDLQDHAAVACADLSSQDFSGLGIIRPSLDHVIQVPSHRWPPSRRVPSCPVAIRYVLNPRRVCCHRRVTPVLPALSRSDAVRRRMIDILGWPSGEQVDE